MIFFLYYSLYILPYTYKIRGGGVKERDGSCKDPSQYRIQAVLSAFKAIDRGRVKRRGMKRGERVNLPIRFIYHTS